MLVFFELASMCGCIAVRRPGRSCSCRSVQAGAELGAKYKSVRVFDLIADYKEVLETLHPGGTFHMGQRAGDMCGPTEEQLVREIGGAVDGLISGFPCPPFSDMGCGHTRK